MTQLFRKREPSLHKLRNVSNHFNRIRLNEEWWVESFRLFSGLLSLSLGLGLRYFIYLHSELAFLNFLWRMWKLEKFRLWQAKQLFSSQFRHVNTLRINVETVNFQATNTHSSGCNLSNGKYFCLFWTSFTSNFVLHGTFDIRKNVRWKTFPVWSCEKLFHFRLFFLASGQRTLSDNSILGATLQLETWSFSG